MTLHGRFIEIGFLVELLERSGHTLATTQFGSCVYNDTRHTLLLPKPQFISF